MRQPPPTRPMLRNLVLAGSALCLAAAAQEPPPADTATPPAPAEAAATEEMAPLGMLVGEWEGEVRIQMGSERQTLRQQEWIEWAAGGEVLVIRGLGRSVDPETGESKRVHEALATLAWDRYRKRYSMWTYAAGRGPLTPEVTVKEGEVVWSYEVPGRGRMRFTIRIDDTGRWVETGELSDDGGATWRPFLEMNLTRVR